MQHIDLRAALGRLAQTMGDQGMVLAQERADDEHAVERAQLRDGHAEPGNAFELAVGGEIRLAQAEIRRARGFPRDALREPAREVELLERGMGAREHAEVAALESPYRL